MRSIFERVICGETTRNQHRLPSIGEHGVGDRDAMGVMAVVRLSFLVKVPIAVHVKDPRLPKSSNQRRWPLDTDIRRRGCQRVIVP